MQSSKNQVGDELCKILLQIMNLSLCIMYLFFIFEKCLFLRNGQITFQKLFLKWHLEGEFHLIYVKCSIRQKLKDNYIKKCFVILSIDIAVSCIYIENDVSKKQILFFLSLF